MRIIAGEYRGRLLKTLRGFRVRPTSGRLRETLFDVLGSAVGDSVFVDCYAGTGGVGLEAASRGARHVYVLEEDSTASGLIRENVRALDASRRVFLLQAPVRLGLRRLERQGVCADICFLDPPYTDPQEADRCLKWLRRSPLMAPEGMIIVQHPRKVLPMEQASQWRRFRLLVQGSNALSFYRAVAEPTAQQPD